MLERFTEEEIAQIKRELGQLERKAQKSKLVEQEMVRLEKLFPRGKYLVTGSVSYRNTISELKEDMMAICDHITHNYTLKAKPTARHKGEHYVRAGCVPGEVSEIYRQAFSDLVDVIEKWYIPWDLVMDEEPESDEPTEPVFVPDSRDSRHLVKLKPGVKKPEI